MTTQRITILLGALALSIAPTAHADAGPGFDGLPPADEDRDGGPDDDDRWPPDSAFTFEDYSELAAAPRSDEPVAHRDDDSATDGTASSNDDARGSERSLDDDWARDETYLPDDDTRSVEMPRSDERRTEDDRYAGGGAVLTPFGGLVTVGGGVGGFTESDMRGATGPAGTWEARGVFGTRSPLSVEAAYVGSAQSIDALGLDEQAALVSNGVEGGLRLGIPISQADLVDARDFGVPILASPYAFGGVGWQHYNLLNDGANTSSIKDEDDVMTLPMGLGLALGIAGITLDTRVTYRHTLFSDLIGNDTTSVSDAALNRWQAGANIGFEF